MSDFVDLEEIGHGAFATVSKCRRTRDGSLFAKKQLLPDVSEESVARFKKEVNWLYRTDHVNIVRVIGKRVGGEPPYFCVMPLYAGSLAERIGELSVVQQLNVFADILEGVHHAHQKGVIHRDLKMENVLVRNGGPAVVSDFGIGMWALDPDWARLTLANQKLGTPAYMAPEQLRDARMADHRSDIFSLGRILAEMRRRWSPVEGGSSEANWRQTVENIAARCTEPEPAARFQSVAELRDAWQDVHPADAGEWAFDPTGGALGLPTALTGEHRSTRGQ